jgi:hypothetical protein
MQWQTAPARWRVLFGKVAEKYRAGGRMQTEYAPYIMLQDFIATSAV